MMKSLSQTNSKDVKYQLMLIIYQGQQTCFTFQYMSSQFVILFLILKEIFYLAASTTLRLSEENFHSIKKYNDFPGCVLELIHLRWLWGHLSLWLPEIILENEVYSEISHHPFVCRCVTFSSSFHLCFFNHYVFFALRS